MSRTDALDEGIGADAPRRPATLRRRFDLHGVVVTYEDGPDRCTIYPRGTRPQNRTSTWLTADASAFVELERMR
ncbi:MAG: hypothetical protein ABEJ28_01570 [Salinigranum sp.]